MVIAKQVAMKEVWTFGPWKSYRHLGKGRNCLVNLLSQALESVDQVLMNNSINTGGSLGPK